MAVINFGGNSANLDSTLGDRGLDIRLARLIDFHKMKKDNGEGSVDQVFSMYPYSSSDTFAHIVYEPVGAIQQEIEELKSGCKKDDSGEPIITPEIQREIDDLENRKKYVGEFMEKNQSKYNAPASLIHPYALIKLAGASGSKYYDSSNEVLFDKAGRRRFYEIDGDEQGGYAKNPTTTNIINWAAEDARGRFTYSFQDFIFCKHWNKIPNNRMITLRRYTAPTTDNLEPSNYDGKGDKMTPSNEPYAPVSTMVTYFGDGAQNKLSDLLSFSFNYNWQEMHAEKHPIDVTSTQNDEGNVLSNEGNVGGALTSALSWYSHLVGFGNDLKGKGTPPILSAGNKPPDPYSNGPYENRILGPVNVIMDTWKRERGLSFKHDSLKLNFEYVSRPIAGINNKAIMLDLIGNLLLMTYASGTWFGGMWRYRCESPANYPWQDGDIMAQLYKGKIFGREGAPMMLVERMKTTLHSIGNVFTDLYDAIVNDFKGILNEASKMMNIPGLNMGEENKDKERAAKTKKSVNTPLNAVQQMISRRALKGASIPYLNNMKALLTGNPVGDWHLTIGNPMNPIAMIGNLIVSNASIKFSDELGPDDFPIGFTATIELKHGLGRDKDAIESMFNRGTGRIYVLPDTLRTSADGETKVDENTGMNGKVRKGYAETSAMHWGGGFRYIMKTESSPLKNTGSAWDEDLHNYESLRTGDHNPALATYYTSPWQTAMNL